MNSTIRNRLENPDKTFLFLDIDGVLANSYQYYTNKKKWHPTFDCYRFDEKCVKVLNQIIETVNPIIILSSDWKLQYSIEQMNQIFDWNKINTAVSDITPCLWGDKYNSLKELEECRAAEILEFVQQHNIINWVAVDDLNLEKWIPNNFVRTPRANEGIKQAGIKEKIIQILKT